MFSLAGIGAGILIRRILFSGLASAGVELAAQEPAAASSCAFAEWIVHPAAGWIAAAAVLLAAAGFYRHRGRALARLRSECDQLRSFASLARIEYFHYNFETGCSLIYPDRYWPERDGKPVPAGEWVHEEDLEAFETQWRRLLAGGMSELQLTYRVRERGRIRYHALFARLGGGPKRVFGLIQDITDLEESIRDGRDIGALFNAMLENFPNPVLVKDLDDDFRYLVANRSFASLLNRTPEEIVGRTDFELFAPRDAGQFRVDDLRVADSRDGTVTLEDRFTDAAGGLRDMLTCKTVIRRSSDGRRLLIAIGTDVSELKRMQYEQEESNRILQTLMDNLPVGIIAKDPDRDFRYVLWNRWMAVQTGLSADEMVGRTDFEVSPYPGMERHFRAVDLATMRRREFNLSDECVNSSGRKVIFNTCRKLLTLNSGRRLLISLRSDVTAERTLELERAAMIAQLTRYVEFERIINGCLQHITLQTDFNESVDFLLREIGEAVGADRCYVFRFEEDGRHASNTHEWTSDGTLPQREMLQHLDMGAFPGALARMKRDEHVVIPDLSEPLPEDLRDSAEFLSSQEIRSLLIASIRENGRTIGFIGVDFVRSRRELIETDLHITRNAASLYLLALERDRQMNALADSISLQKQIFENIAVPILLLDTDFNVVTSNSALRVFDGWELDCRGKKCFQCYCFKDAVPENCPARKVLKSGRAHTEERKIGGRRIQLSAQPIFDRGGRILYVLESGFDITELRRRQEELTQHNLLMFSYLKQDQAVNDCLEMLVLNQDYRGVMHDLALRIGREMEADSCAIFRSDPEAGTLECVEGLDFRALPGEADLPSVIREADYPMCFRSLREENMIAADLDELRENGGRPEARELEGYLRFRGMRAIRCIGIRFQGKFWGHIGMEFADKRFGDAENRLVTSAARIIEVLLEREEAHRSLVRSENEKNIIWELMTVPLFLYDPGMRIVRANPAAERMTGLNSAEILAQPCFKSLCGKPEPPEDCPIRKVMSEGCEQRFELSVRGREYQVHALPVFENGVLVNILQSYIDVTEINENRRLLIDALNAAQAADRAKSFFIAGVSHEIRTPLNAVIGFSELLRDGQVSPGEQKEYLDNIAYSGNALLQLINDVLDLAKLEAGQMQIVPAPTDFGKLGREVMKVFSFRAAERGLELRTRIPELPELDLDRQRIRQILFNLIGNAVKFTERGSIELEAEFRAADAGRGTFRFSVSDTGIGIAEEDRKRLMEPFVQLSNLRGTNASNNGTGLGLSISRRLAERMGGTLWVESAPGRGSTFGVTLEGVGFRAAACLPEPAAAADPAAPLSTPGSILIVDDVEMNLKVLKAMCGKAGVTDVTSVTSGEAALEALKARSFDFVLTDMWMPGMDGVELVRRIRAIPRFAKLPVFAVTADVEAKENFSLEEFSGVLLKPLTQEKVRGVIDAARSRV